MLPHRSRPARTRRARVLPPPLSHATLGEAVGRHPRQQLRWLGLLALPLLLPLTVPGMATSVGALCLLLAGGLLLARPVALPAWLAQRRLPPALGERLQRLLARFNQRLLTRSRPRLLRLSSPRYRHLNGGMLALAGLSMMVPVPVISFDNMVPAAAVVLLAWGLRLRDGALLLAGYLATALAWAYVALLWWAGAEILAWAYRLLQGGWLG